MSTSELLLKITNNEQTIYNELNDILALQDELINPKITFFFGGTEYTLSEKDAYWNSNLKFYFELMEEDCPICNNNSYAEWGIYRITYNSNFVKYDDAIKNGATYFYGEDFEFTIEIDNGNQYLIRSVFGLGATDPLIYLTVKDTRFSQSDDGKYYYFTPEEGGSTYMYPCSDTVNIQLGGIIHMTLVEGGNK